MAKLIAEGGVAGHLAHLYDNKALTFEKIAEILTAASRGSLVGTEKTDGYNIYLGYKSGEARAARNKGDMQKGGMNAVDIAMRVYAGGPDVKRVYVDAFNAFENAVASLSEEERTAIFGTEGEIFYNSEIMGPGASNVVNYDANIITIHGGGHKRYDADTDKVVDADVSASSQALDSVVDRFEQATQGKNFGVQRTAAAELKRLSGGHDLKIALEKIKKAGLQGSMTIEDFLDEKLSLDVVEKFSSLDESLRQQIVDRILKKTGAPTLTQIYRGLGGNAQTKDQVRSYVQTGNKTISKLIWPIEDAIHDFAVAMLEGMQSAYILDNSKELDRLKKEVETAIKSIQAYQGPGEEMAHEILAKQLSKIKHLDNITSVAEGFVFEYDGQLYKFTGNFAPVNQILGLFRYGRGGIKIPKIEEALGMKETVAIIPGAFKPPHRGHLDMVKHYADLSDRVVIMVSPKPRQTPAGKNITQEESISIWNLYIDKTGLSDKVEAIPSPHPSPVRSAYEYVENDAQPGEMVMLGTSTKGGDQSRYAKNVQAYAKEGVRVLDPIKYAFNPVGEELSASDFRDYIDRADINKFLPNGVNPEDVLGIIGIQDRTEEVVEHAALPLFFRLIEEALDEMEPIQKFYAKDWSKKRMSTKGKNKKGGAPFDVNPPKARSKSAPPGFGGALEESERFSEGIQEETWYHGTDSPLEGDIKPLYLTPSKNLADMLGKEVYAFKIKPEAKWFDMGSKESGPYLFSMDTIGYLPDKWEDFTSYGVDVVWDVPDFRKGFEQIFVVDTDVLEMVDMELGEISGVGAVGGYSLPLGAKPQRPKNKKNKKIDEISIGLNKPKKGAAEEALSAIEAKAVANPFNPTEVVFYYSQDGKLYVKLDASVWQGSIHISEISVSPDARGKGLGSKILKRITDEADKSGVAVTLFPKPIGEDGLTAGQLKRWYERHGFKVESNGGMRREAKKNKKIDDGKANN